MISVRLAPIVVSPRVVGSPELIASAKRGSSMILVITGTAESDPNTVSRVLADDLGWKFVDAENLNLSADLAARDCNHSLAKADSSLSIQTLSAALNTWTYEWQDVVVSCPTLTERDRKQLSGMSSLVKIVCLAACPATDRTPFLDRSVHNISYKRPDEWHVTPGGRQESTVDSTRQVEEIVAEVVYGLVLNRQSQSTKTARLFP